MAYRCDFSQIIIPNDQEYRSIARKYVAEVAGKFGFRDADITDVERCVDQAISELIEYSFEPGERATIEVSCERVPQGLKVTIKDRGLPFDPPLAAQKEPDNGSDGRSSVRFKILGLKQCMDEIQLQNLGLEGKETVLIKHLKNKSIQDYHRACDLEPYPNAPASRDWEAGSVRFTVRPMKPSEAVEVSKCVYKAYGRSYAYENAYYPERLIELNQAGQLHSVVAVSDSSEIMGHLALQYRDDNSRIAELCQGVVKPEFRSNNCFTRMTGYLIEKAKSEGLMGVFGQAVTNHTYSQQVALRLELKDCAVILGYVPSTTVFRGMNETLPRRVSLIVHFLYLQRPAEVTGYPPVHHEAMIRKLYENLGVSYQTAIPREQRTLAKGSSIVKSKILGLLNYARIDIERYGENVVQEIRTTLKELCLRRLEVLNLYLDLSDPLTFHLTEEFEKLGFFFAGLLPGAAPKGDALILQYLNNVPMDYADIQVVSSTAAEIVSYIQDHDPNVIRK